MIIIFLCVTLYRLETETTLETLETTALAMEGFASNPTPDYSEEVAYCRVPTNRLNEFVVMDKLRKTTDPYVCKVPDVSLNCGAANSELNDPEVVDSVHSYENACYVGFKSSLTFDALTAYARRMKFQTLGSSIFSLRASPSAASPSASLLNRGGGTGGTGGTGGPSASSASAIQSGSQTPTTPFENGAWSGPSASRPTPTPPALTAPGSRNNTTNTTTPPTNTTNTTNTNTTTKSTTKSTTNTNPAKPQAPLGTIGSRQPSPNSDSDRDRDRDSDNNGNTKQSGDTSYSSSNSLQQVPELPSFNLQINNNTSSGEGGGGGPQYPLPPMYPPHMYPPPMYPYPPHHHHHGMNTAHDDSLGVYNDIATPFLMFAPNSGSGNGNNGNGNGNGNKKDGK